jgi:hypothetical protein
VKASEELKERLVKHQDGKCFICGGEIESEPLSNLEVDHIISRDEGGRDEESNYAAAHKRCNRSRGARPLLLAQRIKKFEIDKKKHKEKLTLGKVLELFRDGEDGRELKIRHLDEGKVQINYEEEGTEKELTPLLYNDPTAGDFTSIFTQLPIKYIDHDKELNPRPISDKNINLISEFYNKRPQLHVCLCRAEGPPLNERFQKYKVLLFDGQHKAAAQLYNDCKKLPVRIFIGCDKTKLKDVNYRAHTELVQMEFFKSIVAEVGYGLFGGRFKDYLEAGGKPPSEAGFLDSLDFGQREKTKKDFERWLQYGILHPDEVSRDAESNRMTPYIEEEKTREKRKPISYDTFHHTFYKYFVYRRPSKAHVDDEENYLRIVERENLVKLMNIVTKKVLEGKYREDMGIYRIEHRLGKGEKIPPEHVKAYRMFRKQICVVWCEVLRDAIKTALKLRGKLTETNAKEGKIFWCKLDEDDWKMIEKMVDRICNHKLWLLDKKEIIDAIKLNRKEEAVKLVTEGVVGEEKVIDQPINLQYVMGP